MPAQATNGRPELGSYRLIQQIGAGGMGAVWLAEHVVLGRRAAVKVLHATFSHRPEIVARFFNEARAASAISDQGIVQIFDFGQHADGNAYIVMELLEGEPLDRRLRRVGAFSIADALRIVRQVANSLAAAHAHGIVHRDLKPENIILVPDPEIPGGERAKIVDFGIAKLVDTANVKTQTATILGTPMFMSPEQCRGAGKLDHRSDIYSLGCVLFTLIAGRPPFEAEGPGDIVAMHLREPAPLLSSFVPAVPGALDELVARCLAKHPDDRFGSASDLVAAILQINPTGSLPVDPTLSLELPRRRKSWRLGTLGLAVAAVAAAITFGIAWTMSSRTPEPTRPIPPAPAPPVVTPPPDAQPAPPPAPAPAEVQPEPEPEPAPAPAPAPKPKAPPPVRVAKPPPPKPAEPAPPIAGDDGIPDVRILDRRRHEGEQP